jgi:mRNA interferase MazF
MTLIQLSTMRKGEVWMVELPSLSGREQVGRRPAVILADINVPVVVIVPCTSNMRALRFPYTITVRPSKSNGLEKTSVMLVFHMRAIDRRRLVSKIGFVGKSTVDQLDKIIKGMLDI